MELSRVVDADMKEEYNDDLQWLQQAINNDQPPEPLWKSYGDLLRLMLAHFDAVEILANSVTSPQFSSKAINMKILVTPNVDIKMLSWRDLFMKQVFPKHSMEDRLTTNKNLLKFLSEAISSKPGKAVIFVKDLKMHFGKIATINNKTEMEIASFLAGSKAELHSWRISGGCRNVLNPQTFSLTYPASTRNLIRCWTLSSFSVASKGQTSQGWWTSSSAHYIAKPALPPSSNSH